MKVIKEEVLPKFREWAGSQKTRIKTSSFLFEDAIEGLENFLQALNLDAENLPELYVELKQAEEKVAEGIFYSPVDEIEFLIRQCLLHQLSQRLPHLTKLILQSFCFGEAELVQKQLSPEDKQGIIRVLCCELKVVDPSCGVGDFLVQYARIITNWMVKLAPQTDLESEIGAILVGGISGVDSDPIAVLITRVRLAAFFYTILGLKSKSTSNDFIKNLLKISIVWGNALGTEISGSILISARNWVKESELKRLYLDLCKKAVAIFQNGKITYKNAQDLKDIKELNTQYAEFLQKLMPSESPEINQIYPIFAWDVNFAHILNDGGFNIVIGNPPYIRQEDIATAHINPDRPWRSRKIDQEGRRGNRQFKKDLIAGWSVLTELAGMALSSKSDLSAYFFLLAKYLCTKNGICGYITPNAWLDVQYGFELQGFLAQHTTLIGLYERKFTRAFSAAAINTIITLFVPNPSNTIAKEPPRVESLSVGTDYKEYLRAVSGEQINPQNSLTFKGARIQSFKLPNNGFRREIAAQDLISLGKDEKSGANLGFKWGSLLLRAPDFFFELQKQIAPHMVPFFDVIDLNFGLKTGKNAFFMVPNKHVQVKQEDQSFFLDIPDMEKIPVPPNVLKPIIVSSRGLSTYTLAEGIGTKYLVHITNDLPPDLVPYVNWGQQRRFHLAPSCQAHHPHWFNLPKQKSPDFIFFRFMDQRMWVPVNRGQFLFSDNFFIGYAKDPAYVNPCAAYFNSTLNLFFSEIWGRTGLGEGLLTFYGPDYRFLEVLDPRNLDRSTLDDLNRLFFDLSIQPVQPILEDLQNSARISLDAFIMERIFNLPKSYQLRLYDAFRALVTQRLGRAKRKY